MSDPTPCPWCNRPAPHVQSEHFGPATLTGADEMPHPAHPMSDPTRAPIDANGQITIDRLAGLLCRDAQEENYDHGPHPTVSEFRDPLPSCPRHHAAASVMLALSTTPAPLFRDDIRRRLVDTHGETVVTEFEFAAGMSRSTP